MKTEILGVDIGGVIIDRANDKTDTSFFSDNYLATTAVVGAVAALRWLTAERFGGRVFLVSKCGQKIQGRTLEWLNHHRFWQRTGIGSECIRFCRRRFEKAKICHELGITHFVDDRLQVLGGLDVGVTKRYLFQPRAAEKKRFAKFLPLVREVKNWDEILDDLLP